MTPTPDQREKALNFIEGLLCDYFDGNEPSDADKVNWQTIRAALTAPPQVPQEVIDGVMELQHWQTQMPLYKFTPEQFREWENKKHALLEKFWKTTKALAIIQGGK